MRHSHARRVRQKVAENADFVRVVGMVHQQTSLGVFLELARQRLVFIPLNCMSSPWEKFQAGEPATILVLRNFAEEERLVAHST
jgi:hypothetical protein